MGRKRIDVRHALKLLRDAGVQKARLTVDDGGLTSLDVEFEAAPLPVTPFVDAKGRPVDFDEGMPALARDPDDESSDAAIERANFKPRDVS